MCAYRAPGRNPTTCPVSPISRASMLLKVASMESRMLVSASFPSICQLVGWTRDEGIGHRATVGCDGAAGCGAVSGSSVDEAACAVGLGFGVGVFGVGVKTGVEVADGP